MYNKFFLKLFHVSFRLLSMLAKFILVILLSKYLGNNDLGEYSLFFTTISMSIFFLGMDFYVFNTREIIAVDKRDQAIYIRDQFIFYLLTYILFLPILYSVFICGIINFKYIIIFYLVLICEHLSQEFYRLFITLSKQTLAVIILFIRSALWIYIIILMWCLHFGWKYISLSFIYYSWFLSALLSIIISGYFLVKEYGFSSFKGKINYLWIKKGVVISFPFFIGTIFYKIVEFSNRYIIDIFMDKSSVGIFSFYINIANSLQTLVYTLVIMIYFPKLLKLYNNKDEEDLDILIKNFSKEIILYSLIFSSLIIIATYIISLYLDEKEISEYFSILLILLGAVFFLNLSFVEHYQLFAKKKDLLIRNITIIVGIVNVLLTIVGVNLWGLYGGAMAYLISFLLMFIIKKIYNKKDLKE